ncbi:MAG: flagellar motor switch protein FliM [Rickettsiales bacterium]
MSEAAENTMNQDQVDDIFGAASNAEATPVKTGIEQLIDKALSTHIRLPMLEIVYDRFVRVISNSLRNYTSFTVDVDINKISNIRFGDYMDRMPIPSMIGVIKAIEWDNFGLVVIESSLIYSFVEILFGGRKTASTLKVEGRPYTSIEQNIVQSITEIILDDLSTCFESVSPVTFQLDRLESNPKFAAIARPEDVIVSLSLSVAMESRHGKIDIIFPVATLEPVKKILTRSFLGERGSKDPIWLRHFESEISNATLKAEVTLNGKTASLKEAMDLKVGSTIMLDILPTDELSMKISNIKVSSGKLGKVDDKMAIQLSDGINLSKFKS